MIKLVKLLLFEDLKMVGEKLRSQSWKRSRKWVQMNI